MPEHPVGLTTTHALAWVDTSDGGPAVRLIDQTRLPGEVAMIDCRDVETLAEAIRSLRVRGAPVLGLAGAYGVVLGVMRGAASASVAAELTAQRPTAVNLGWAAHRVAAAGDDPATLLAAAREIDAANEAACAAMGHHGAQVIGGERVRLLTHCNTGFLACGGIGTAFGVARTLHDHGRLDELLIDETRPLLQGARLTAWEAAAVGMAHSVLPDSAAAGLILYGEVDAVVVGADRIAANGDTANKVGTLGLALACARAAVPFYVVAPVSTIDHGTETGAGIEIEERHADEVHGWGGTRWTPAGSGARNPAFDVTPADVITGIVTELGVHDPGDLPGADGG